MLQFFSLLFVEDNKCVEETRAADLELGVTFLGVVLDFYRFGILPPSAQKEIFDLLDFAWHVEYHLLPSGIH